MKIEYDSIIDNNIDNVKEHEIFDSKSALYRKLGFNYKSFSKDRIKALDRHIAQYMKVASTNNPNKKREIAVEEKYKKKQPIEDNRRNNKGGNNKKYGEYSCSC